MVIWRASICLQVMAWRIALSLFVAGLAMGAYQQVFGMSTAGDCQQVSGSGRSTIELTQRGHYCLSSDLKWELPGAAIRIAGSNIHFDLKGNNLQGVSGKDDQIGILIDEGFSDIFIKNGQISSLQIGIKAQNVSGMVVEKLLISDISFIGSQINGSENRILDSEFSDIGKPDDDDRREAYAVGVLVGGNKMLIKGNRFYNVNRPAVDLAWAGEGVSILISEGSEQFSIIGNNLSNTNDWKHTIGIWARTENFIFEGNKISGVERPIEGEYGGSTRLVDNFFEFKGLPQNFKTGLKGERTRAVAMKIKKNSDTFIKNNKFIGFSCPIHLGGDAQRSATKIENNTAVLSRKWRFCGDDGVWYSPEIFGPKTTKIPSRKK